MSVVTLKYCGKCRRFKSRCAFAKKRAAKDGLQPRCKACVAEYNAQHYRDNAEAYRERNAQYYRDNAEAAREYSAQYRRGNAEQVRERNAQYYRDNAEALREYQVQYRRDNADAKRVHNRRRRAQKANAPHSPYDVAQYYGLPCYECGAPATVADHVFPLSKPGPLTWDAPWNLLPHCGTHSSRKSNRPPVWYWEQHHRAFDLVRLIQDDAQWFDSEPDWAHVAAGL